MSSTDATGLLGHMCTSCTCMHSGSYHHTRVFITVFWPYHNWHRAYEPKPKMLSSRIELETLAVLKPCDNQLHHESLVDDTQHKPGAMIAQSVCMCGTDLGFPCRKRASRIALALQTCYCLDREGASRTFNVCMFCCERFLERFGMIRKFGDRA